MKTAETSTLHSKAAISQSARSTSITASDNVLVEGYIDYLRTEKELKPSSILAYVADLVRFCTYLRGQSKRVADVDHDDIRAWLDSMLEEHLTPYSVARKLCALRRFYHFLVGEKQLRTNPALLVSSKKPSRKLPQFLSTEQVDMLLAAPDINTPRGLRDHVMMHLLYATGMRVTELVSLPLANIDLEHGLILVEREERARCVSCSETARLGMAEYLRVVRPRWAYEDSSPHMFVTERGRLMTRQGFWKLLSRYAREVGIQTAVSPSQLRHSFALHMLERGSDLRSVQETLGHAMVETTKVYIDLATKLQKAASNHQALSA